MCLFVVQYELGEFDPHDAWSALLVQESELLLADPSINQAHVLDEESSLSTQSLRIQVGTVHLSNLR